MSDERPKHKVAVAAVTVDDDDRILLFKRRNGGHWELPGGVLEPDEGVIDALTREVREETGIRIVPGSLTGVYKNESDPVVALVFRARRAGGRTQTSDESLDTRWLSEAEALETVGDEYATWISDALEDSGVQVRTQERFEMGTSGDGA